MWPIWPLSFDDPKTHISFLEVYIGLSLAICVPSSLVKHGFSCTTLRGGVRWGGQRKRHGLWTRRLRSLLDKCWFGGPWASLFACVDFSLLICKRKKWNARGLSDLSFVYFSGTEAEVWTLSPSPQLQPQPVYLGLLTRLLKRIYLRKKSAAT